MDEGLKDKLRAVFGAAFVVGFVLVLLQHADFVKELATGYGLIGLFFASIIANATVVLPLPIDLVVLAVNAQSGNLLEIIVLGLVLGSGAAIGEMTAYIAGLLGVETAERLKEGEFRRIKEVRLRIEKTGALFIFLAALIPFPFDIIGITAGIIKYNPKKFFFAALCGKSLRYMLLGATAYYGFAAIKGLHLVQ